ncbi:MAG: helix-turn-helix transcriptional regulator [Bacteroidales bacterium]|nr:helix-turn-helix transcriptional regulator [Bacteroidales bacterium]
MEKTIGMRVKECRRKLGMTQEELAELMCVTPVQISHYENDKNDIKVSVLKELAGHLQVPVVYLSDGECNCFSQEVMQVAMMLQEMQNGELRKAAMEQVKILAGLDGMRN